MMAGFIARLICKHTYIPIDEFIAGGMEKVRVVKCVKCGKTVYTSNYRKYKKLIGGEQ